MRIDLDNGKYTYISNGTGLQYALRYGEEWRDLTGDKFIAEMAYKIEDLEAKISDLNEEIKSLRIFHHLV